MGRGKRDGETESNGKERGKTAEKERRERKRKRGHDGVNGRSWKGGRSGIETDVKGRKRVGWIRQHSGGGGGDIKEMRG